MLIYLGDQSTITIYLLVPGCCFCSLISGPRPRFYVLMQVVMVDKGVAGDRTERLKNLLWKIWIIRLKRVSQSELIGGRINTRSFPLVLRTFLLFSTVHNL